MRQIIRGLAVTALLVAASASAASAADKLKIGVTATLEGTYTVLGEDGVRGLKVALAEFGNRAGGRDGAIAAPEANGRYVVYSCTQAMFFSLDTCAKILDVPSNTLHFVGGTVGGGFGGKVDTLTEPLAILGAMLTGRPVRYRLGREEMQFGSPRGAERIYMKDGVRRDGRIVARSVRAYFDSGAYTRLSSYAVVKCAAHIPGPYTIPNVYADVYCVYTNRVPSTAMRGFGAPRWISPSSGRWTSSPIWSAGTRWSSAS